MGPARPCLLARGVSQVSRCARCLPSLIPHPRHRHAVQWQRRCHTEAASTGRRRRSVARRPRNHRPSREGGSDHAFTGAPGEVGEEGEGGQAATSAQDLPAIPAPVQVRSAGDSPLSPPRAPFSPVHGGPRCLQQLQTFPSFSTPRALSPGMGERTAHTTRTFPRSGRSHLLTLTSDGFLREKGTCLGACLGSDRKQHSLPRPQQS